jgi:uncharacterized membrane protein
VVFNKKSLFWILVTKKSFRLWEIDFLRGIAVVMMIVFHFFYDLNFFSIYEIDLHSGPFPLFLYPIGTTFLLLVGISLSLSYSRIEDNENKKQLQLKFILRGSKIFGLGLLITLVTWIYLQDGFVVFGILHCIGLSIIIAYPFLQFKIRNLIIGVLLVSVGVYLKTLTFDFGWFLWLGFRPSQFYTVDYFPILPWFGVVLIGIFIGNTLYPAHKRRFKLKDISQIRFVKLFCFLGRHSLIIYCLHQPIIILLIHLFLL